MRTSLGVAFAYRAGHPRHGHGRHSAGVHREPARRIREERGARRPRASRRPPGAPASPPKRRVIAASSPARRRPARPDGAPFRSGRGRPARARGCDARRSGRRRRAVRIRPAGDRSCPSSRKAALKLDRVMVCWDGSRAAARAVADACRCCRRPSRSRSSSSPGKAAKGDEIARRRSRPASRPPRPQGRASSASPRPTSTSHSTILSYAADSSADMIVMGGYGHSRLREFILGGVTRGMLRVDDGAGADVALSRQCRPAAKPLGFAPDAARGGGEGNARTPRRPAQRRTVLHPAAEAGRRGALSRLPGRSDAGGSAAAVFRAHARGQPAADRQAHPLRSRATPWPSSPSRKRPARCSASCACTTTDGRDRRVRHPAALASQGPRARLADDEAHDRLREATRA